jgi:hypothetical protein
MRTYRIVRKTALLAFSVMISFILIVLYTPTLSKEVFTISMVRGDQSDRIVTIYSNRLLASSHIKSDYKYGIDNKKAGFFSDKRARATKRDYDLLIKYAISALESSNPIPYELAINGQEIIVHTLRIDGKHLYSSVVSADENISAVIDLLGEYRLGIVRQE